MAGQMTVREMLQTASAVQHAIAEQDLAWFDDNQERVNAAFHLAYQLSNWTQVLIWAALWGVLDGPGKARIEADVAQGQRLGRCALLGVGDGQV